MNIAPFKQAFEANKVHHAWLLSGQRGSGKLKFALDATTMLMESEEPIRANSPQIFYVSSEENNAIGIEEMRGIKKFTMLSSDQARVVIINSLDEVSSEGEDTILKLLEEPPLGVYFFLLSNGLKTPKATIRSRARVLRFRSQPTESLPQMSEDPAKQQALVYFSHNNEEIAHNILRADPELDTLLAFHKAVLGLPNTDTKLILDAIKAAKSAEPFLWQCLFDILLKKLTKDAIASPIVGLKVWDEIQALYRASKWAYVDSRALMLGLFYNYKRLAGTQVGKSISR